MRSTVIEAARKAVGNWKRFQSFAWHDRPDDAEKWAIFYTHNRDSGLIDQSNASVIEKALGRFIERGSVRREHHGHWACGWVDGYAIRVFRQDGHVTKAFSTYHELTERLDNYPILDESDYSNREYQATIENLKSEGFDSDLYNPPAGWAGKVFSWLWDHDQSAVENRDDQGGYATAHKSMRQWTRLGYRILYAVKQPGEPDQIFDSEDAASDRRMGRLRSGQ